MKAIIIYEGKVVDKLPTLQVDDYGDVFTFHIVNEDGSAVDLTDQTINFKAKKLNDFDEYLIDAACVITDAEAGYCTFTIVSGSLDTEGSFASSLELVKAATNQFSIELGYLNVNEDN